MFVVVENTPGYLPDSDDPATFDTVEEAKAYLAEEVERYLDQDLDAESSFEVSWSDDRQQAYVTDLNREHDLGRVFEVVVDES